jgi:ketopantoate reductase
MKLGIVGAGAVGSACLLSVVIRGSAREVVLVNRNRKRAEGVVTDVQYGAVLSPPVAVRAGLQLLQANEKENEEKNGHIIGHSDTPTQLGALPYTVN